MASIDEHKKTVESLIEDINEKIMAGTLVGRQKIVGFAASEAATNMFAILLHKKKLISEGSQVNHRFFASLKRAKSAFCKDFEKKDEILNLLVKQEFFRDKLCYGKTKSGSLINDAVKNLFELKKLIETLLEETL